MFAFLEFKHHAFTLQDNRPAVGFGNFEQLFRRVKDDGMFNHRQEVPVALAVAKGITVSQGQPVFIDNSLENFVFIGVRFGGNCAGKCVATPFLNLSRPGIKAVLFSKWLD